MFLKLLFNISLFVLTLLPVATQADSNDLRASFNDNKFSLTYAPLTFSDGTNLTLITPENYRSLINKLSNVVIATHQRFNTILGPIPKLSTTIRLMEEKEFFKTTQAPSWTNALYYKNEIIIPIPNEYRSFNFNDIARAIKHEYTHAVINALTNGRCPGWLDEGIAQWAENHESKALKKALLKHLKENDLIPLNLLQGGFTKLNSELVAVAYAQSLYLTRAIINQHGFLALKKFFKLLRLGHKKDTAFIAAFNMNERYLEIVYKKRLLRRLYRHKQ